MRAWEALQNFSLHKYGMAFFLIYVPINPAKIIFRKISIFVDVVSLAFFQEFIIISPKYRISKCVHLNLKNMFSIIVVVIFIMRYQNMCARCIQLPGHDKICTANDQRKLQHSHQQKSHFKVRCCFVIVVILGQHQQTIVTFLNHKTY